MLNQQIREYLPKDVSYTGQLRVSMFVIQSTIRILAEETSNDSC